MYFIYYQSASRKLFILTSPTIHSCQLKSNIFCRLYKILSKFCKNSTNLVFWKSFLAFFKRFKIYKSCQRWFTTNEWSLCQNTYNTNGKIRINFRCCNSEVFYRRLRPQLSFFLRSHKDTKDAKIHITKYQSLPELWLFWKSRFACKYLNTVHYIQNLQIAILSVAIYESDYFN